MVPPKPVATPLFQTASGAIAIDFGLAKKYGGTCNLRFDDTNPIKEDTEYIESIVAKGEESIRA